MTLERLSKKGVLNGNPPTNFFISSDYNNIWHDTWVLKNFVEKANGLIYILIKLGPLHVSADSIFKDSLKQQLLIMNTLQFIRKTLCLQDIIMCYTSLNFVFLKKRDPIGKSPQPIIHSSDNNKVWDNDWILCILSGES